jgi:hypothetical protein
MFLKSLISDRATPRWSLCRSWTRTYGLFLVSKSEWSMAPTSGTGRYHMTSSGSGIGCGGTPLRGALTGCHSVTKLRGALTGCHSVTKLGVDHSRWASSPVVCFFLVAFLRETTARISYLGVRLCAAWCCCALKDSMEGEGWWRGGWATSSSLVLKCTLATASWDAIVIWDWSFSFPFSFLVPFFFFFHHFV